MKKPNSYLLAFIISLAAFSTNVITPSLVSIKHFFNVSFNAAQFVVTIYLLGYALGQLIYGPISHRFGRKPALYIGVFISLMGSLLCALSRYFDSFASLLIFRFLGALGAASGYTLSFNMINDAYTPDEARKEIPKAAYGLIFLPYLAVTIGGLIEQYIGGWISVFYFLAIYSLVLIGVIMLLPETGNNLDKGSFNIKAIYQNYANVARYPSLLVNSFIVGCCVSMFYGFSATAPIVGIHVIGATPSIFGYFSIIPAFVFLCGNFVVKATTSKISPWQGLIWGEITLGIGVIIMFVLFACQIVNLYTLFLPTIVIFLGLIFLWNNAALLATKGITDKAHASSLMSFINVGTSVVALFIISALQLENPLVLPSILWVIWGLILIDLFLVHRLTDFK